MPEESVFPPEPASTQPPPAAGATPPPGTTTPPPTLNQALEDVKKREGTFNLDDAPGGVSEKVNLSTAKWLLDMYADIYCMFLRNYAQIDKKHVYEAILNGYLNEQYLKIIDEANKKADTAITITDEQKKFILEPLQEFITIHKIKIPPGIRVIIGLIAVSLSVFIVANEIRKDNEFMLKNIILQSQKKRDTITNPDDDGVQTVTAEIIPNPPSEGTASTTYVPSAQ